MICSRQIYMTLSRRQPYTVLTEATRSMTSISKSLPAVLKKTFPVCGSRSVRHSYSRMNCWKIWPPGLRNWSSSPHHSKWKPILSSQRVPSRRHGMSSRTYSVFDYRGMCGGAGRFERAIRIPTGNPSPICTKGTDHQSVAVPFFFV